MKKLKPILLILLLSLCHLVTAYNLRQFSSKNGLSNSAILSICQQRNGLLWFGSCDGLNSFDGVNFRTYHSPDGKNNLSGNLIESILEAEEGILWIQTNYGLDRLNTHNKTIKHFNDFKSSNKIARSPNNEIYVVKEDKYLYYYHPQQGKFRPIHLPNLLQQDIREIAIDSKSTLWIVATDGHCYNFRVVPTASDIKLTPQRSLKHSRNIRWCSIEGDILYYIDDNDDLYEYELVSNQAYYVHNISPEVKHRGEISSIIKKNKDYYIAFKSSGMISLTYQPSKKNKYSVTDIAIKSGIFCLVKDKFQDIIWVGTDGQGAFMHFSDTHSITSVPSSSLQAEINNPIRALWLDKEQTLWIGTKGSGIICLENYSPITNTYNSTRQLLVDNSVLADNSVYCFTSGTGNVLWIGTEYGLNYYSYREKKLKPIPVTTTDGKAVKYVHSICQFNDSTLWIATLGEGIVKAHLDIKSGVPVITAAQRISIDKGKRSSNYFFVAYKENDSIMWFGNCSLGAYRLNVETDKSQFYRFSEASSNQTLNDMFTIHRNQQGMWFGTSYGLTYLSNERMQVFNIHNNLPSNTIHGIQEDNRQNLWLSTNEGMVKLNIKDNTVRTYKHHNELSISEFSDGAYSRDERTGTLFFGGIDGFITIHDNGFSHKEYTPPMQFSNLLIYGKEFNLTDFINTEKKPAILKLTHKQNFFSIDFTALDYLNSSSYSYYYKIDGTNNNWVDNGNSSTATFTSLVPGTYSLLTKYRNNATGSESDIQSLKIVILPPWYQTPAAWFVYFLLSTVFTLTCIRLIVNQLHTRRDKMIEQMNSKQRDEIYESKLRIFTNIIHEFCTPLTLIYGPCEKIISYAKSDSYIQKYAMLIKHNTERLNTLIQELIEFRRLETGHKKIQIRRVFITKQLSNIFVSFRGLAEIKNIVYQSSIQEDIWWNSDFNCLNTIVSNLISNAFKYTPDNGTISIEAFVEEQQVHIIVVNSGKGIKKEDLNKIFDHYTILDSVEVSNKTTLSFRNGLGLAICDSMVHLLEGEIRVSSIPDETTSFEVVLPLISLTDDETVNESVETFTQTLIDLHHIPPTPESIAQNFNANRRTIMLIDDDPSMLSFITRLFVDQYNVIPISNPRKVLEHLKISLPDLIISDVMMPEMDGISLIKMIKSNELLYHIPLILLSARHDIEEQVRALESGAELYLTKPFNVKHLEKVVARLLKREEEMKNYYGSVHSTFQLDDGRFIHKGDNEFFEKMMQVIDSNMANTEFSVEILSASLGYSTRQFYRILKRITDKTPADIIKEYRLSVVERLLTTSNLSVDEICFKVGLLNRGNFYKIFVQQYDTTPKKYRMQKQMEFKKMTAKK